MMHQDIPSSRLPQAERDWSEFRAAVRDTQALIQRNGLLAADDFVTTLEQIQSLPCTKHVPSSLYLAGMRGTMGNAWRGL